MPEQCDYGTPTKSRSCRSQRVQHLCTGRLLAGPPTDPVDTLTMRLISGRTWPESWEAGAGVDEGIKREEKRRNRAERAAECTGGENPTHPGKTVTLSVAMASSSFHRQVLVKTFPPVPREIPASEQLLHAH